MNKQHPKNLLELRPTRNLEWETKEDELVILLVPKFQNRYAVRWFLPLLAKPSIRVKLDAFGSYVWNRSDGMTTVQEIGEQMSAKFGEPLEPLYDRIGKFIHTLVRDKFLLLDLENTLMRNESHPL